MTLPLPAPHPPLAPEDHVLIVGAGFSGTLLAANLVRFGGPRVTLVERMPAQLGRGVAYSAEQASQLLNVRAAGMSAYPDDLGHFARWAAGQGAAADGFVARAAYGRYLIETLLAARESAGDRLTLVTGEVVALDGPCAVLADGTRIAADAAVLTLGNLPPHDPPGLAPDALPEGVFVSDPWSGRIAEGLGADDTVVLIGTGLTAIDVILKLADRGFAGRILAMSRRGLAPRRHVDGGAPPAGLLNPPEGALSALTRDVRRTAGEGSWRAAVDALRPVTQRWWARADRDTRRRFLRHLRPFWDVHRHRLAPQVADRIDALVARGQLTFAAGKIVGAEPDGTAAALRWRPRGAEAPATVRAARIVNCTGPQGDIRRSDEPLLRGLLAAGRIRPDALNLGIEVDPQSRVVAADGTADPALYCVGPMTRGSFWEIVAVPDIRRQCADLARRLANAGWVAEGL